jgi:hypothetical protein
VTAMIAFAAIAVFTAGVCTGILGVVSIAIHLEDKHLTLTREATGFVTRAGRWLTGVHVVRAARHSAGPQGPGAADLRRA